MMYMIGTVVSFVILLVLFVGFNFMGIKDSFSTIGDSFVLSIILIVTSFVWPFTFVVIGIMQLIKYMPRLEVKK